MRNRFRLDRSIIPTAYSIELEPDLAKFRFTGRETITLKAAKPFAQITLHAIELSIKNASLRTRRGAQPIRAERITYDKKMETATCHFSARVPAGSKLELELEFSGVINDKLRGFYRTAYDVGGKKHWGAATQFEATDARRAFPCWDEPDCKATFQFALRVPKHLTALSNMPITEERALPGGKLKRVAYAPSVVMSTYLLAWVIADLESVETNDRRGVPVRVWTTPGKKEQGRFALEVGKFSLDYFGKWFGIPYALPKLDMVALPDFASGAMENWGLVTYRETALLVDPQQSSAQAKQRVAEVIAHELAHQWFGNLVTMAWWTDLWLNEGFASYMGPKAVDAQFPEWQIWSQFVAGEFLAALRDDSLRSSHPIEIPVENPAEIRSIFDHITYSKGSSVNRMLEHYLTEPMFRKGLGVYLKRYTFGNARTQDLWAVLEQVSRKPVKAIMASFTKQEGYPVLTVRAAKKPGELSVEQRRFVMDGASDAKRMRWHVPIVSIAQGSRQPSYTILRAQRTTLRLPPNAQWIKLNAGQSGFYRVAYEPRLLQQLAGAISRQELSAIDALGVLDDALALARAGDIRTSGALDLVAGCTGYRDYNLWQTVAGILHAVEGLLQDEALIRRVAMVGIGLFGPLGRQLGWERRLSDGHLDALLRSLALGRLGHYGDRATLEEARSRFARFRDTGELLPDIRGAVYATIAEHGGEADYEPLVQIYRKSPLQEERVRVLRALTCFRVPSLVTRVLNWTLSDEVRRQDAYVLLAGFGQNPIGRDIAWAFVKARWAALVERYSDGGLNLMTRIIEGATSGFVTREGLADAQAFFKTHPVPGAERSMKQSIESIQAAIRWAGRDRDDIRRWLTSR